MRTLTPTLRCMRPYDGLYARLHALQSSAGSEQVTSG
jgi:hypothetical protein